jgi:hypothetical protein
MSQGSALSKATLLERVMIMKGAQMARNIGATFSLDQTPPRGYASVAGACRLHEKFGLWQRVGLLGSPPADDGQRALQPQPVPQRQVARQPHCSPQVQRSAFARVQSQAAFSHKH